MSLVLRKLSGWLLIASLITSIVSATLGSIRSYWAGILIWLAFIVLLPYVKKSQRKQILLLLIVGSLGLALGLFFNVDMAVYLKALEANQKVINMLIAVVFLKLLISEKNKSNSLPKGPKALAITLLNTHLFSSVINMSSVVIVGDRLAQQAPLKPIQGVILLRAFGMCALWSPFFAAMGLVLLTISGAQFSTVMLYGLPTAIASMIFTVWQVARKKDFQELYGYPMAFESLWMPFSLAFIVMGLHALLPDLSILTLVSITTVLFTALCVILKQRGNGLKRLVQHVNMEVAESKGEVVLFAAAAILASGVTALFTSLNIDIIPEHFGYLEACITLFSLVLLAMVGMHPVASAILAGSLLAPSASDPNLLAITLLMGWSLAITLSPFSGIQLSIQSRYSLSAMTILKLNIHFAGCMMLCCLTVLWLYTYWM